MLSQHSLEAATRQAGIGAEPVFVAETASTNTDAISLAERGAPAWTVVATGHQTAGRGRLGRTWAAAPERSLTFSIVLRPGLVADEVPPVALLAACEMVHTCRETGVPAASKWPNDLVVGDRKVGGLLAESRIAGAVVKFVVLGVGVNVSTRAEEFPAELRGFATSLAIEGAAVEVDALLVSFLTRFRDAATFTDPGFAARAVSAYRSVCATLGRRVRVTTVDGRRVEGAAAGIDARGHLLVEGADGAVAVAFGEVAHVG